MKYPGSAAPGPAGRQSGVALIIVLLAFALIGSLAAGMITGQQLMIHKASHYLDQRQARSYALGAEAFARQILVRDWEDDEEDGAHTDDPEELWAKNSVALPIDQGAIEMQINALQGRVNLNDLVDQQGQVDPLTRDRVSRLLRALGVTTINVEKLIDWIDPDDQVTGSGGAEDGQYLLLDPPYRAANQPFTDLSELRLIEGISAEDLELLLPHVAVLPARGQGININFATGPVIQSLHDNITEGMAESVIAAREEEVFPTIQDFLARDEFAGLGLKEDGLTLENRFFEAAARVTLGERVYSLVSRLYRNADGEIQLISRDASETSIITKERISAQSQE